MGDFSIARRDDVFLENFKQAVGINLAADQCIVADQERNILSFEIGNHALQFQIRVCVLEHSKTVTCQNDLQLDFVLAHGIHVVLDVSQSP